MNFQIMKTTVLILVIIISSFYGSHSVIVNNFKSSDGKFFSISSIDTLIIKVKKKDFDAEIIAACQGWQEIIKCGIINTDVEWEKINNKKILSWKTYMAVSTSLNNIKKDIDVMNLKCASPFELIGYVMTKKELHKAYFIYFNKDVGLQALYCGTHIEYKISYGDVNNNYAPGCQFLCKE